MRLRFFIAMLAAYSLVASPGAAATLGPGAFVGARMHLPFGKHSASKPRAALAIAPTSSRLSADGVIRTRVGEGLAFNLSPREKPTLTLAGVRADRALNKEG